MVTSTHIARKACECKKDTSSRIEDSAGRSPKGSSINTKIIATLGPATQNEKAITALAKAGVTVFRLNSSHGTHDDLKKCVNIIRKVEQKLDKFLPIMQDLQGPKIRLNRFKKNRVVNNGEVFTLYVCKDPNDQANKICISYPELVKDIKPGHRIFINDGNVELKALKVTRSGIEVLTVKGGLLEPRKGVNLPDTCINIPSLTEQDLDDLKFGVQNDVDYVAMSFVRSAKDVLHLKGLLKKMKSSAGIISKIEKPQALKEIDEIVKISDVVLVARGDLGVEIKLEKVPAVQKKILELGFRHKTPVIVATQMLESMIKNPRPTRAEATDVFQAVADGADAVMLSGETAVGSYPVEAVEVMGRIIAEGERSLEGQRPFLKITENTDEAIAETSAEITDKINARFICCFTSSGWTARLISKNAHRHPVVAFTENERTARRIALYKGVHPVSVNRKLKSLDEMFTMAGNILKELGLAKKDEKFVIVAGSPLGISGKTNLLKVHTVM